MTWHPAIGSPDPASAWATDEQLDRQRADEQAAHDFQHMLKRRERFESDAARVTDPTPEERATLWTRADQETE